MHDAKGIVIVAAIAALELAGGAQAQQDAAQKVQEGSVAQWIEYYRNERAKPAAPLPPKRASAPNNAPAAEPAESARPDRVQPRQK